MPDDHSLSEALADRITRKILNGRLPSDIKSRIFTGRGSGFPCACCGMAISNVQPEYEIECAPLNANSLCVMHGGCYRGWFAALSRIELEARTTEPQPESLGQPTLANLVALADENPPLRI